MVEPGAIGNLIFLSYRRADTAAQALALRLELETQLRAAQIFLDTHTIQGGDVWPKQWCLECYFADTSHHTTLVGSCLQRRTLN